MLLPAFSFSNFITQCHFITNHTLLFITSLFIYLYSWYIPGWQLLGLNTSATANVIARPWNDDEMPVSLVKETGIPRGNHGPMASNFHTYGPYLVLVPNLGQSGVNPGDLRCHESNALAHSVTKAPLVGNVDIFLQFGQAWESCIPEGSPIKIWSGSHQILFMWNAWK